MTGFRPRRASPTIFRGGGTRDFAWSRAAGGTPTAFDRLLCTRLGTKAGELLGYRPSVSIQEGIARYVRWFQEKMGVVMALD